MIAAIPLFPGTQPRHPKTKKSSSLVRVCLLNYALSRSGNCEETYYKASSKGSRISTRRVGPVRHYKHPLAEAGIDIERDTVWLVTPLLRTKGRWRIAAGAVIASAIGIPGAVTQLPVTPQRLKRLLNGRTR